MVLDSIKIRNCSTVEHVNGVEKATYCGKPCDLIWDIDLFVRGNYRGSDSRCVAIEEYSTLLNVGTNRRGNFGLRIKRDIDETRTGQSPKLMEKKRAKLPMRANGEYCGSSISENEVPNLRGSALKEDKLSIQYATEDNIRGGIRERNDAIANEEPTKELLGNGQRKQDALWLPRPIGKSSCFEALVDLGTGPPACLAGGHSPRTSTISLC